MANDRFRTGGVPGARPERPTVTSLPAPEVVPWAGAAAGHDMAEPWSQKRGVTRKFGLHLMHPELGASRIRMCDGSREAALWAEAHQDPELWPSTGLPDVVIEALAGADDD